MAVNTWSEKEIDYLIKNYGKIKTSEIALTLDKKISNIQSRANRLGLKFTKPKTKECIKCKKTYPKTNEYFFKREIKQLNASNELLIYKTYKSLCKYCHKKDTANRQRQKRIKELNCTEEEYNKRWRIKYRYDRLKYKELKDIPKSKRGYIIKKMNNGYNFIDLETYKKDCSLNRSLAKRKYDYKAKDRKLTPKEINDMCHKILTDSVVSNKMGYKLEDVPKDVLETNRLLIQIKREIKK